MDNIVTNKTKQKTNKHTKNYTENKKIGRPIASPNQTQIILNQKTVNVYKNTIYFDPCQGKKCKKVCRFYSLIYCFVTVYNMFI